MEMDDNEVEFDSPTKEFDELEKSRRNGFQSVMLS